MWLPGLVGHSMGGYGASRIGMKHPEVFGALYIMSPCCMSAPRRRSGQSGNCESAGVVHSFEIYSGTHTSAVAVRFQNYVMPFFGKNLCKTANCK